MIVQAVQKVIYEIDEEAYNALDTVDIKEAIKDGRVKVVSVESLLLNENGDILEAEIIDSEDIDEAIEEYMNEEA